MSNTSRILIIDGSLGGKEGNTGVFVSRAKQHLEGLGTEVHALFLAEENDPAALEPFLLNAHGFIFSTGTYWDSWGSPMQRFLEVATRWEGTPLFLGKPAAVLVTMHSVGGKQIVSRLQGVLNTLGCGIPPMSALVCSLVVQLALKAEGEDEWKEDLSWPAEDLGVVCHNLVEALRGTHRWESWPFDRGNPQRRWVK